MVNQAAFAWAERINTDITNVSIETVNAGTIVGMITGSVPKRSLETSLGNCRQNLKETVDILEETVDSEAPLDPNLYRRLTRDHAYLTAQTESIEKDYRKPVPFWSLKSKYWETLKLHREAVEIEQGTIELKQKAQTSSEFARIARRKEQFGITTELSDTWSICSKPNGSRVSMVPDLHSVSEEGPHDEEAASITSSELVQHQDDQENIPMHDILHELRASVDGSRDSRRQGFSQDDQAVSSSEPGGSTNNDGGIQTEDHENVREEGAPFGGSSRPSDAQPPTITTSIAHEVDETEVVRVRDTHDAQVTSVLFFQSSESEGRTA